MKLSKAAIAATFLALTCGAAHAQIGINPNAPLDFSGDETNFNPDTCILQLNGRVEITQDRARLRAGSVTAQHVRRGSDCGAIGQINARGDVYYVTPEQTIRADSATYNLTTQEAVFTGNVIAVQGDDVSTAERMTVNLDTGALSMTGRVRGVVYPQPSSGAAQ